jgi:hypothetical protein
MAKKEKSFASKMGHQKVTSVKPKCPVCKTEVEPIVYVAATYAADGTWSPRKQNVLLCNCNRKAIYG